MRKYIILGVFVVASLIFMGVNNSYNTAPWQKDSLLSASTASGSNGTAVNYPVPLADFTCVAVWSGTTPSNIILSIKGSLDASSYGTYTTVTMESSPKVFNITNYPTLYLLASYDSSSAGAASTALTVDCLGIGR